MVPCVLLSACASSKQKSLHAAEMPKLESKPVFARE